MHFLQMVLVMHNIRKLYNDDVSCDKSKKNSIFSLSSLFPTLVPLTCWALSSVLVVDIYCCEMVAYIDSLFFLGFRGTSACLQWSMPDWQAYPGQGMGKLGSV